LKQFITLTGRKIRYLWIDGAKEFQFDEIKEYRAENNVVRQFVLAYNHTMRGGCNWLHQTAQPNVFVTR